jgi:hypothetical protein
MGGGGGSGEENNSVGEPGANGGGIIILSAPTIVGGGGELLANGLQPTNPACAPDPLQAQGDGGGGGGAGGTIILNATTISGTITASANGGQGSNSSNLVDDCTGPGGGGGGGIIWAAGASFPAAVTASVTGGVNGVVSSGNSKASCRGASNGATSGAVGVTQSGYVAPVPGSAVCTVLALSALRSFNAAPWNGEVAVVWTMSSITIPGIRTFVLQRATGTNEFQDLALVPASADSIVYHYTDPAQGIVGPVSYRLSWQDQTGAWFYSRVVALMLTPGPGAPSLTLQPNPAADQVTLTIYSRVADNAGITVSDVLGQSLASMRVMLQPGMNTVVIPLGNLAPAVYFLALEQESGRQVREFIKK